MRRPTGCGKPTRIFVFREFLLTITLFSMSLILSGSVTPCGHSGGIEMDGRAAWDAQFKKFLTEMRSFRDVRVRG